MSLYLGLDCSTQSLSAILIEAAGECRRVLLERSVIFDRDLPAYGTRHGVLPSDDPLVVTTPPTMWAEALDRLMGEVAAFGIDLSALAAIAGSAQQHGSVYLGASAAARLAALDPGRALAPQLDGIWTRPDAPTWMDASTTAECREIAAAIGGDERLARLTGSRAFERFTGPQIRRFAHRDPSGYAATTRIHFVSSFMASLLIGGDAPVDPGDASGGNLMDLASSQWSPDALAATAPDLARRLPAIVPAHTVVGPLSRFWQTRHGLPAARVVVWSGDNPCSLVGTGLVREGRLSVSLGTSDTIFGLMREPHVDPGGDGHVFGAPTGDFMGLTCFRNGSLAREAVRDAFGLDWSGFDRALDRTPPGNDGALMLPWFAPEITPMGAPAGVRRRGLDPDDAARNVRAVVEAQMMAMANHSAWMGVHVDEIHATGGASVNDRILQVMADVFSADVLRFATANSACLGAALRACHADRLADGAAIAWDDVIRGFAEPDRSTHVRPRPEHAARYRDLRERYRAFERETVRA